MADEIVKSGYFMMLIVAIEQLFPKKKRIINDELAHQFLPFSLRSLVWLARHLRARDWIVKRFETKRPGLWISTTCRKRYVDEKLIESTANNTHAMLNLGAGFDTLAYRLPAKETIPIWEIDQPQTIQLKQTRLHKIFNKIPDNLKLVPADLNQQKLEPVLTAYGYNNNRAAFFIWAGVSQYLTQKGVEQTFEFLAKARSGSRLVFTYVNNDFLEGKAFFGREKLYRQWVVKEKIWRFGLEPEKIADFLKDYGWSILEHLGYAQLAEQYAQPTGRKLISTVDEGLTYIVYAEKK